MPLREAAGLGTLMNARGLMELVILDVGLDIGVISPALFSMMVVMALVTTFMTTPILNLICPKELLQGAPDKMMTKPVTAPSLAVHETETSVA
jgi:Kef-type K+ transport system membrane component KefB